jgi:hypothetical protein
MSAILAAKLGMLHLLFGTDAGTSFLLWPFFCRISSTTTTHSELMVVLDSSKHPASKQRGGNGSRNLKWMLTALATLVIGKAVWDTVVSPTREMTTTNRSGTSAVRSSSSTDKTKSAGGGGGNYLYDDEPHVIEVTSEEGFFQTSQKPRIVEFYSPYCVRSSSWIVARFNVLVSARSL